MQLPTSAEIIPHNDLDGQWAEKHFLGKDLDAAEELFQQNSIYYQEDLMFMGAVAFCYYVEALIRYIRSDASVGDSDIINCMVGILEQRLELDGLELAPVSQSLASVCEYILENYEKYCVTRDVYGDLKPQFASLRMSFVQMAESAGS